MSEKRRVFKIAEKIRHIVAMELNRLADPRLYLVTVTSVMVSPDLRNAKIYWMASGGKERIAEVEKALGNATLLLKRSVGKGLGIRYVPDLRFFYDDTLDTSQEVERLLEKAKLGPEV